MAGSDLERLDVLSEAIPFGAYPSLYYLAVALPREISERLFMLCDTTIEGEAKNVRAIMAEMSRDELESVLAEAEAVITVLPVPGSVGADPARAEVETSDSAGKRHGQRDGPSRLH